MTMTMTMATTMTMCEADPPPAARGVVGRRHSAYLSAKTRAVAWAGAAALLVSCTTAATDSSDHEDASGTVAGAAVPATDGTAGTTVSGGAGTSANATGGADTTPSGSDAGTTGPSSDSTGADSTGGASSVCAFTEDFEGIADGEPWPAPWVEAGGVLVADVQDGRGRLLPIISGYSLARMYAPISCVEAEGTFTFSFGDDQTQGVGVYLRQNGGYLQDTNPSGAGLAAFAESFRDPPGIAIWHEIDGEELQLTPVTPAAILAGETYSVRFRITQQDAATTLLQSKVWAADEAEPTGWAVEVTDATPSLQGIAGGLAIDAWAALTRGAATEMFIDDIVVTDP